MRKILFYILAFLGLVTLTVSPEVIKSEKYPPLLNTKAEEYGYRAYDYCIKHHINKKDILIIIDFTKPSTEKRFFVIDMKTHKILYSTWVAHGTNSGSGKYATSFSNQDGSHKSSIGVFRTSYIYNGSHTHSLKIEGLEPGINDNVSSRSIIVHPASYIGNGQTGHSWGCFAIPDAVAYDIIETIKDGAIIVAYYPDQNWLLNSKFLNT